MMVHMKRAARLAPETARETERPEDASPTCPICAGVFEMLRSDLDTEAASLRNQGTDIGDERNFRWDVVLRSYVNRVFTPRLKAIPPYLNRSRCKRRITALLIDIAAINNDAQLQVVLSELMLLLCDWHNDMNRTGSGDEHCYE